MWWRLYRAMAIALSFGLQVGALVSPPAARAEHHNWGKHVLAAAACPAASANTATSTGVAACSPPARRSDCGADPTNALAFLGTSRFRTAPNGRTLTPSQSTTDVNTSFRIRRIVDCQSSQFGAALEAPLRVRITTNDPTCAGGWCTLPDLDIPFAIGCRNGVCRGKHFATEGPTPPPVPLSLPWSGPLLSWNVRDPAGTPLTAIGLLLGFPQGNEAIPFPAEAVNWEGRFVQAFAPCAPGTEDTVTTAGAPACSQPRPLSDCSTDPTHAVKVSAGGGGNYFGSPGKGKVGLALDPLRTEVFIRHVKFSGLLDCAENPYQGVLTLVALVRATLVDPACAGGLCTTVDTEVRLPLSVADGKVGGRKLTFPLASTFRSGNTTAPLNAEIVSFDLRDASDNPVMTGPGYLVRCDRSGNPTSCFGN
jgi:hypothetical protein